jgi:hypothetical protein
MRIIAFLVIMLTLGRGTSWGYDDRTYRSPAKNIYEIKGLEKHEAFSLSMWIHPYSVEPSSQVLLSSPGEKQGGICFRLAQSKVEIAIRGMAGLRAGRDIEPNAWHHVVLTFDSQAGRMRLYLNNSKVAEEDVARNSAVNLERATILGWVTDEGVQQKYKGLMDSLYLYDRVLSSDEIASLHGKAKPDRNGLKLSYTFHRTIPMTTMIPDSSGHGRYAKVYRKYKLVLPDKFDPKPVLSDRELVNFDKLVFVKRTTYTANHYYTEFINSQWRPGGNICVLDLKTGDVHDLVPELKGGVFERFDLSFNSDKIVFAWKANPQQGYRLYEIEIDPDTGKRTGTTVRQLTFPPPNEQALQERFGSKSYHHGTDDMQPCYLPDGGLVFISTRVQYSTLCDATDNFTTTVLYRMDGDGKNMRRLTNSSVSEASPVILPDGRIMYTRWEYLDKGAVGVKCLWAVRPDGTGSSEIYGADIALPPTMIYGRPIPNTINKYVMLGAPHAPQNAMGTVIRLDMQGNIRTREPMTYLTPYVDIQGVSGFHFLDENQEWILDAEGAGALFKDPYPLSEAYYLVSYKSEESVMWNDPAGYGLCLLNEKGEVAPIYRDPDTSCWLPYPLKKRSRPPLLTSPVDAFLAERNLAKCVVTDIYHGMAEVERGSIKYIRVLEQIPRPWRARRRWEGDAYDLQHACISKDTHLGLKVQHGVVPVEADGSAHFLVPAMANITFQALDENYLAVQTERTYVNYMPGEERACIGCHETPGSVVTPGAKSAVDALKRVPSVPAPQPGEATGLRPLDYMVDVQPVWDKHCIKCHSGEEPKGGLDLTGKLTDLFCISYEELVPWFPSKKYQTRFNSRSTRNLSRYYTRNLLGPTIGENHPKTGNVHYLPPRSLGSHASVLAAMLAPDRIKLRKPEDAARAARLAKRHKDIRLTDLELLRITNWIDTNHQYYGMYWGRRHISHKAHPNFRPRATRARAVSAVSLVPEDER